MPRTIICDSDRPRMRPRRVRRENFTGTRSPVVVVSSVRGIVYSFPPAGPGSAGSVGVLGTGADGAGGVPPEPTSPPGVVVLPVFCAPAAAVSACVPTSLPAARGRLRSRLGGRGLRPRGFSAGCRLRRGRAPTAIPVTTTAAAGAVEDLLRALTATGGDREAPVHGVLRVLLGAHGVVEVEAHEAQEPVDRVGGGSLRCSRYFKNDRNEGGRCTRDFRRFSAGWFCTDSGMIPVSRPVPLLFGAVQGRSSFFFGPPRGLTCCSRRKTSSFMARRLE